MSTARRSTRVARPVPQSPPPLDPTSASTDTSDIEVDEDDKMGITRPTPASRLGKRKAPTGPITPDRNGFTAPVARSKLSTEKTTSADNLTLAASRPTRSSGLKQEPVDLKPDIIMIDSDATITDEDIPKKASPPTRASRARKPKYAVSSDDDDDDFTPSHGKGKTAARRKKAVESDDDDDDDFDYAMNSDDEEAQLRQALRESARESNGKQKRGSSSSSSSTPAKRKRATSSSSKAQAVGGKGGKLSKSSTPRRSAMARAAELRAQAAGGSSTPNSAASGSPLPSPISGSSTPVAIPSDEESFSDDYDSDELSEGAIQEAEDYDAELLRQSEEKTIIRAKEDTLKEELGRKLTQGEKNQIRLCMHHPDLVDAWGDLEANVVPVKPVPMEAHPSLKLTLLPFQKESLYWMKKQEEGPWAGGMLADEMGMGKTIQTIALLLSEPRQKPALVVAPVVALMQWKHEIETHAEGFSVCLWHGSGRMKASQLQKFDVVLVSYGTLEASFRRQQRGFKKGDLIIKEKSPMHTFEWYRVILDEAHNIKERSTNAAKAAFALQAKYRWCLSGTPLQNRVGELYSLVRFLGADPFSYYFCKKCPCKSLHWQFSNRRTCDDCGHKPMDHVSLWNSEILTPIARYGIEEGGPGKTAFKKLKILLDRMMLRRTKLERADDLGLPPRTIVVRRDFFSPPEKELYMSLFTNAKREFDTYLDQGTVLNNYSNIFSLITRMRQMACHPDLVLRSKSSSLGQAVNEGTVCRICNDTAEDAIVSACKHVFDRECIRQYLEVQQLRGHQPECPVCHIDISIDLEQEAIEVDTEGKRARQGILSRLNLDNWRSSSKLEALVEELEKLRREDCTIKSLVFSQFVSFLDLIAFRLQRAGFNICRLEGGMTPQQRDATIQHFMKNTGVTVFLISLKAGGVALNLTEASMVFMMDSWWNPSVEYQAMDRIHRLGQKRSVKVVKLVVEDSIEDQIVQLQAKKLAMTDAALSRDPDAALGKLTVEDLGFLFKL